MKRTMISHFSLIPTFLSIFILGIYEHIKRCFCKGNTRLLLNMLTKSVEIAIPLQLSSVGRTASMNLLKDFFKNNHPLDFNVIHKGCTESEGFLVGILHTLTGNYHVYLLLDKNHNKYFINNIRIEESNE